MRFNNRACALMEIPDLPQDAFEHYGDGKIKPQGGGGGGIISAVTDPISSVLGTDGGGGGILGAVEDVGQSIGSGLAEVDKFVNREVPGGWVTVGLTAAGATAYTLAADAAIAAGASTAEAAAAGSAAAQAAEAAALLDAAALAEGGVTAGMAAAANTGLPLGTVTLANSGFVGLTPEFAAELGLEGGSALGTTGASGDVLAGIPLEEAIVTYPGDEQYIAQDLMEQARATNVPAGSPTSWDTGVKSFITPSMAIQGARLGMGLLGGQPQQQQALPQMGGAMNRMPQGAVDYSGIYNLLALQRARNPNSLLG